jgi:hypothetical protein
MPLITIPNETDGTDADAADLNTRFAIVTGLVNGNIDNANIKSGGVTTANLATDSVSTAKIANDAVTGAKIATYKIQSQEDTTNTTQTTAVIQTGWGQIFGNGTASMTETITFPTPFTKVLGVSVTSLGYKTGGATAAAIGEFNANINPPSIVSSVNITTSGFTVVFVASSGTLGGAYHGYSWMVIGI